jgi:hypothetical protein
MDRSVRAPSKRARTGVRDNQKHAKADDDASGQAHLELGAPMAIE